MKQLLIILIIALFAHSATAQSSWIKISAKPVTECVTYNVHKVKARAFIGDSVLMVKRMISRQTGDLKDTIMTVHQSVFFGLVDVDKSKKEREAAIEKFNLEAKTRD